MMIAILLGIVLFISMAIASSIVVYLSNKEAV